MFSALSPIIYLFFRGCDRAPIATNSILGADLPSGCHTIFRVMFVEENALFFDELGKAVRHVNGNTPGVRQLARGVPTFLGDWVFWGSHFFPALAYY